MFAAKNNQLDLVRYLANNGADVNAADQEGTTALMYASAEGYVDIVQHLVKEGADVNLENQDGKSAMDHAVHNTHQAVQRLLMPHTRRTRAVNTIGTSRVSAPSTLTPDKFISPFEV